MQPTNRTTMLGNILDEILAFEIPLNPYYDDREPQGVIDDVLTGKIDSLRAILQLLGWADLASQLEELTPLQGDAVRALALVKNVVVPEVRHRANTINIDDQQSSNEWFWDFVHPRIKALAKPRFDAGFYGDAVEACFKDVNDAVKRIVHEAHGRELDGHGLMTTAFSPQSPLIKLSALQSETDRSIQQGYMQIFAGSMTGIRNPKAHGNLNPDSAKALHLIALASLLMHKIDERVEP